MPNKTNAQYNEWKIFFKKLVDLLDDNFILIGHSLGGIFLTKYLSENQVNKIIKKTFLIAAPYDDGGMDKEPMYSFLRSGDLKKMENQAGKIYIYQSKDDFAVPFDHLEKYRKAIPSATVREFEDRNHFLQEIIPELINDIKEI